MSDLNDLIRTKIDYEEGAASRDAEVAELRAEVERLTQWVHDLQRGMFINCVYCGHRYGPNDEVPATMADALKEHVERCPKHPMSAMRTERDAARRELDAVRDRVREACESLSREAHLHEGVGSADLARGKRSAALLIERALDDGDS